MVYGNVTKNDVSSFLTPIAVCAAPEVDSSPGSRQFLSPAIRCLHSPGRSSPGSALHVGKSGGTYLDAAEAVVSVWTSVLWKATHDFTTSNVLLCRNSNGPPQNSSMRSQYFKSVFHHFPCPRVAIIVHFLSIIKIYTCEIKSINIWYTVWVIHVISCI